MNPASPRVNRVASLRARCARKGRRLNQRRHGNRDPISGAQRPRSPSPRKPTITFGPVKGQLSGRSFSASSWQGELSANPWPFVNGQLKIHFIFARSGVSWVHTPPQPQGPSGASDGRSLLTLTGNASFQGGLGPYEPHQDNFSTLQDNALDVTLGDGQGPLSRPQWPLHPCYPGLVQTRPDPCTLPSRCKTSNGFGVQPFRPHHHDDSAETRSRTWQRAALTTLIRSLDKASGAQGLSGHLVVRQDAH